MTHTLADLPALLRSPLGRRFVLAAGLNRLCRPLFAVAGAHRRTLTRSTRWVAVVGSFGKTTTTRAVVTALGGQSHRRIGWNAKAFLAFNVLRVRPRDRYAVIEVGINGPGQMAPNARVIRPDVVVVTSIGSEHNRSFVTLDATRHEKAEMVRSLPATGLAVLNADDPNVMWMASQTRARVITFGFHASANVSAADYSLDWPHGSRLTVRVNGRTLAVPTGLLGRHMAYPVLASIAVAQAEGHSEADVLARLASLEPSPRCLEPVRLSNGAIALRDEYKSSIETIDTAFDLVAEVPAKRRILVLGEPSEPKGPKRQIYRYLGERSARIFDRAILLVDQAYTSFAGAARENGMPREAMARVPTIGAAVAALPRDLGAGDVVLIKGRASQRMERVLLALSGRQVRCQLTYCDAHLIGCDRCPMLERGW